MSVHDDTSKCIRGVFNDSDENLCWDTVKDAPNNKATTARALVLINNNLCELIHEVKATRRIINGLQESK